MIDKKSLTRDWILSKKREFSGSDPSIIERSDYDQSDLEMKFSHVLADGVFIRYALDEKRSLGGGIPKAHYRFIFSSVITDK